MPSSFGIRALAIFALSAILASPAFAQQPAASATPQAPLPGQIAAAKKIFVSYVGTTLISGMGGSFQDYSGDPDRAYYEFYAALKGLGRYELVPTPAGADLIFEVGMHSQIIKTASSENIYTLGVRVLDPATRVALWGFERCIPTAITQKNRDKNFDQTLNGIVQDFLALANKH